MKHAPRGSRLHVALFGRRNVGKSSLLNLLFGQELAIVSETAGTTTDPVEKPMELLPLGTVQFVDTAGIDDVGALGAQRVQKSLQVIDRTELALLVAEAGSFGDFEEQLLGRLQEREIPVVVVFNKSDLGRPSDALRQSLKLRKIRTVETDALHGKGRNELREALIRGAPEDFVEPQSLLSDLVPPGELALLVVPIDMEAPKGRLILPQVQTLRELLDHDAMGLVVKDRELREALERLHKPPALVITDSQAFLKVAADTPEAVPMTSFSILFARQRGNLSDLVRGALHIDALRDGARVLVSEACNHHPIGDDIGTVKIPRWLRQYVGGRIGFEHVRGHGFPEDLADYDLVIHCGSCVHNRREMLSRISRCQAAGVPITNYGLAIAYTLGIFERALRPFPGAYEHYEQLRRDGALRAKSATKS
jgi:[FeFe] hydrogenase H-cluster maturation GTPase HydF